MAGVEVGDFGSPDETRAPDKTTIEIVRMGSANASRMRLEPGWRWSECVKPIAGTDSCQVPHVGYVLSGRMRVRMDDGTELEAGPDDAVVIPPGHDAWVLGDESCVMLDFSGADQYAKGASQSR